MTSLQAAIQYRFGQPYATVIRGLLYPPNGGRMTQREMALRLGIKRSTLAMWIGELRSTGELDKEAPVA